MSIYKIVNEYNNFIKLISISNGEEFDPNNIQHLTNPILFDRKIAVSNIEFEQILQRELKQYSTENRLKTTAEEFKHKLMFELKNKIQFILNNHSEKGTYRISSGILQAEKFIEYLKNRKEVDENKLENDLMKFEKILPNINLYIAVNSTVEDWMCFFRGTPQLNKIILSTDKHFTNKIFAEFLDKLFLEFIFKIPDMDMQTKSPVSVKLHFDKFCFDD